MGGHGSSPQQPLRVSEMLTAPVCAGGDRVDARTASSGSSVWEGQLQSLVLSEYASTEMSLHALYMHQVSGQEGPEPRNQGGR